MKENSLSINEYNKLYAENGLRHGYTTGTCATAATVAALMVLMKEEVVAVSVDTPAGIRLSIDVEDFKLEKDSASCSVRKFSGDDPDITDGIEVCSTLTYMQDDSFESVEVEIDGGIGVGRVTKKGLDQPIGNAAINSTPRRMIKEHVEELAKKYGLRGKIKIVISVPEGEEKAKKTFNPKLGIIGGISILGTTGIVTPMSKKALLDTVKVELKVRLESSDIIVGVPGNYAVSYSNANYGIPMDLPVEFSNYIGESLDLAVNLRAGSILLIGHIGKFVKVAAGIMNTHSNDADARCEILAAHVLKVKLSSVKGIDAEISCDKEESSELKLYRYELAKKMLESNTTDEAVDILVAEGIISEVASSIVKDMYSHVYRRINKAVTLRDKLGKADGSESAAYMKKFKLGVITFNNNYGELARYGDVEEILERIKGV
jgi:cobalamin biosynthesis protein cbiD